ncbi:hypothetical protein ACFE04_005732 [Oxalis oulophora]
MDLETCQDCKRKTEVVMDHQTGDIICSACGLILENHCIDDTAEWRTFTDDNNSNKDPNRVGATHNPFLDGSNLTTFILKSDKGGASDKLNGSKFTLKSNSDINLTTNFQTIATMAERLGLVHLIKHRACQIYKQVVETKCCRGRKVDSVLAACVHIACKEEKLSRTFKEIAEATNSVSPKEILKSKKMIDMNLGIKVVSDQPEAQQVRRLCSSLCMDKKAVKAVQEAHQKSQLMDIRRTPQTILAAIIYAVSQHTDDKKTIGEVARMTRVSEGTIKKCLKDLYDDISKLIPTWIVSNPHGISKN